MNLTDDDAKPPSILPRLSTYTDLVVYDEGTNQLGKTSLAELRAKLFPLLPANLSPVAALSLSKNGIRLGQTTDITVTASDPDGVVTAATVYDDNVPIQTLTSFPATFAYQPTAEGTHQIKVVALDNGGATGSASLPLVVVPAAVVVAPVPVITFPSVGNKTVGDPAFALAATSTNQGVAIAYTSSDPSVISVSGTTATVVGAGTARLTATQAAGNGYALGAAYQDVTVSPVVTPPVAPTYPMVLSKTKLTDDAGEVTIAISDVYPDLTFSFQPNPGGDSTPKNMACYIGSTFALTVDFPATYTNTSTPFRVDAGGHIYTGTFTDGNVTLTQFS